MIDPKDNRKGGPHTMTPIRALFRGFAATAAAGALLLIPWAMTGTIGTYAAAATICGTEQPINSHTRTVATFDGPAGADVLTIRNDGLSRSTGDVVVIDANGAVVASVAAPVDPDGADAWTLDASGHPFPWTVSGTPRVSVFVNVCGPAPATTTTEAPTTTADDTTTTEGPAPSTTSEPPPSTTESPTTTQGPTPSTTSEPPPSSTLPPPASTTMPPGTPPSPPTDPRIPPLPTPSTTRPPDVSPPPDDSASPPETPEIPEPLPTTTLPGTMPIPCPPGYYVSGYEIDANGLEDVARPICLPLVESG